MNSKYETMSIQKYWSLPSSYDQARRHATLERLIDEQQYIYSLKTDGVFSRAIFATDEPMLQSRGISKVTGTYGRMEDKMLWFDAANAAFSKETVILGECFIPGGIDKDVGSITRSLLPRALKLQEKTPVHWRMFDCLCWEGEDLLNTPIEERIKYLAMAEKRINHPLVEAVKYYPMNENFFDELGAIFQANGEGVVLYKKGSTYQPDKRGPAWANIKIKQEVASNIDCFIIAPVECEKNYNGGDIANWQFWYNTRTGEKLIGDYFGDYQAGTPVIPISKNYYYNWPASILVGVYDGQGRVVELCKVAGLTEEFKSELRDNFDEWYMCPISISGMMVSTANAGADGNGISVRHPILKSIRREDIDAKDCTLAKILN